MPQLVGYKHPVRFPPELPQFSIKFLTDPSDVVLDIFSGSNTTGSVAEDLGRNWLSIELDRTYAALSAIRFMGARTESQAFSALAAIEAGEMVDISSVVPPEAQTALASERGRA
jgi:DNA modification methylase